MGRRTPEHSRCNLFFFWEFGWRHAFDISARSKGTTLKMHASIASSFGGLLEACNPQFSGEHWNSTEDVCFFRGFGAFTISMCGRGTGPTGLLVVEFVWDLHVITTYVHTKTNRASLGLYQSFLSLQMTCLKCPQPRDDKL